MKNGFPGLLIPVGAFFLFILLSSSCEQTAKNGSSQTVSDSLEAILLQRLDRYYSDLSSRNWDAYADHFWPGSRLTTVWQPPDADSLQLTTTTIEEFIAQADRGPGSQPIFEEKMRKAKIRVYNNLATAWVTYAAKFGTQDSLLEWEGIDAFTYMKHDNRWRIISLAYTPVETP